MIAAIVTIIIVVGLRLRRHARDHHRARRLG
jgi:hypothetical protein